MAAPILYIGNKNYSSWSMRPWLAMTWGGVAFEERVIPLGVEGYGKSKIKDVLAVSPSGRVPALHVGGVIINDSLSICEWAAEQTPSLWPREALTRALARSAAAEMHSSFAALRGALSMNVRRRMERSPPIADDAQADCARLFELWTGLRQEYGVGGPFLFGARSIADAMYAPVVTRLRTYAIKTPPVVAEYCTTIFADDAFRAWEAGAEAEPWTIESAEGLYR